MAGLSFYFVVIFTVIEAWLFTMYNEDYHPFKDIIIGMKRKEKNVKNSENNKQQGPL